MVRLISSIPSRRNDRTYAELGREEDVGALARAREPVANQVLVVVVDVGRVPERQSELMGAVQEGEAFRVRLGGTVEGGETLQQRPASIQRLSRTDSADQLPCSRARRQ